MTVPSFSAWLTRLEEFSRTLDSTPSPRGILDLAFDFLGVPQSRLGITQEWHRAFLTGLFFTIFAFLAALLGNMYTAVLCKEEQIHKKFKVCCEEKKWVDARKDGNSRAFFHSLDETKGVQWWGLSAKHVTRAVVHAYLRLDDGHWVVEKRRFKAPLVLNALVVWKLDEVARVRSPNGRACRGVGRGEMDGRNGVDGRNEMDGSDEVSRMDGRDKRDGIGKVGSMDGTNKMDGIDGKNEVKSMNELVDAKSPNKLSGRDGMESNEVSEGMQSNDVVIVESKPSKSIEFIKANTSVEIKPLFDEERLAESLRCLEFATAMFITDLAKLGIPETSIIGAALNPNENQSDGEEEEQDEAPATARSPRDVIGHVMFYDRLAKRVMMTIRGLVDFSSEEILYNLFSDDSMELDSSLRFQARLGLAKRAHTVVQDTYEHLIQALMKSKYKQVMLTGHGLGGGVATLVSLLLRTRLGSDVEIVCYAFGAPGCLSIVNPHPLSLLQEKYGDLQIFTICHGCDFVPRASKTSAELGFKMMCAADEISFREYDLVDRMIWLRTAKQGGEGIPQSVQDYIWNKAGIVRDVTDSTTWYSPGFLIHLESKWATKAGLIATPVVYNEVDDDWNTVLTKAMPVSFVGTNWLGDHDAQMYKTVLAHTEVEA